MQASKSFGRRAAASPVVSASLPAVRKIRSAPVVERREPAPASTAPTVEGAANPPANRSLTVEQELEQWKEARKIRKRSFREPWRSVSIVAGLGFVATSSMLQLPDSVSLIAQIALGVLSLGSFLAGWRVRKPRQHNLSA
jgi:hypothetical protein